MFACMLVDQIGIQIYDQILILTNCSKGKLRRAVLIGLCLKGVKMVERLRKLGCMFVYPICIQTYDQVYILKIWSNLRLHHAVLLGFGLKMATIALNVVKFGMHSYFSNAVLNL